MKLFREEEINKNEAIERNRNGKLIRREIKRDTIEWKISSYAKEREIRRETI